jgi:hypothetical protein
MYVFFYSKNLISYSWFCVWIRALIRFYFQNWIKKQNFRILSDLSCFEFEKLPNNFKLKTFTYFID